ncbi:MAG: TlpA disulfide reductase family protein [Desulfobacterales bacterium]|jgi:peroxiredoxin
MNKKILSVLTAFCLLLFHEGFRGETRAQNIDLIKIGDNFPQVPLIAPKDMAARRYLALPETMSFALNEIKADLVLVEILSVHCPSCQRQAPVYNKLYELIEKDANSRGRIKMIGIAVGNSSREVKAFMERYEVRFPIIADPEFLMHRAIGGSRTPFAIYVRQDPSSGAGIVAGTHLGPNRKYKRLLKKLKKLMNRDLAALRQEGRKTSGKRAAVKPILSGTELVQSVKNAFATSPDDITNFQQVFFKNGRKVYTGLVRENGSDQRLFAEVVSRPPTCDVCHDIHFIYVFDRTGKLLAFVPLQLTKWGNKVWTEKDVATMRRQIVGKTITEPLIFNPAVDAISRATITSSIIYDSLSQGQALLERLKEKGFI